MPRPQPQRTRIDSEDEEDEEEIGVDIIQVGEDHLDKKARDLVRLALFSEHKRIPLRRDEINKKVLASHARSFNAVLAKAQVHLRKTFALELVQLQAQDPPDDLQNATGVKKKATATGSKTFILRSILDPAIIEQAALSDERLLEQDIVEGDEDDDEDVPRKYGSIIAWSTADQLAALGLLHVILALVLVNGRAISELDLRANLKRLRIPPNGTIPSNAQSTHRTMSIDLFLQQLVRQGYLDRLRIGESKSVTGKRRGRLSATQGTANNEDGPQAYEWHWGNRAHAEVGEQAVAAFVGEFMVERINLAEEEEEEEEDGAGPTGRRRGKQRQKDGLEQRLEAMVKAIERAAGGNLSGVN